MDIKPNTLQLQQELASRVSSLGRDPARGTSSWFAGCGHLTTVMVGLGVLALPSAMSWLGWIGGSICLIVFFCITLVASWLLAAAYKVDGIRHPTYRDAVRSVLGKRSARAVWVVQHAMLILTTIGVHIAAADSLAFIAHSACSTRPGCISQQWVMTLVFAGAQLVLSMLPNLESVWWTSVIGAATSIGYTVLIVGIGAAGTTVSTVEGDLMGRFDVPLLQRIIATCTAVGEVISSFGSVVVQIEVQHTLREPPDSKTSMRKAISMAMAIALVLYLLVSWLGYASLGRAASSTGSVLLVFSGVPAWVMLLGNAMVLAHMLTTYQVFCQPMFVTLEAALVSAVPALDRWAGAGGYAGNARELVVRFTMRWAYVGVITVIALYFPNFGAVLALIGAIEYWPLAVHIPITMYCRLRPKLHSAVRWVLLTIDNCTLFVCLCVLAGSAANIVMSESQSAVGKI